MIVLKPKPGPFADLSDIAALMLMTGVFNVVYIAAYTATAFAVWRALSALFGGAS